MLISQGLDLSKKTFLSSVWRFLGWFTWGHMQACSVTHSHLPLYTYINTSFFLRFYSLSTVNSAKLGMWFSSTVSWFMSIVESSALQFFMSNAKFQCQCMKQYAFHVSRRSWGSGQGKSSISSCSCPNERLKAQRYTVIKFLPKVSTESDENKV